MTAASGAPTMADVAQRAGVSHQTVSRVLNDAQAVRPQTRDAVLKAIAELGYRRNQAARALVTRRSGLIGVMVDELALYGPASTVSSVAQAAREAGYGITLYLLWDITGSSVATRLRAPAQPGGRGGRARRRRTARCRMPRCWNTCRCRSSPSTASWAPDAPTAGVDQRAGGLMATRHLLGLGHRSIAHIPRPGGLAPGRPPVTPASSRP